MAGQLTGQRFFAGFFLRGRFAAPVVWSTILRAISLKSSFLRERLGMV
jgi:hypothetical protein